VNLDVVPDLKDAKDPIETLRGQLEQTMKARASARSRSRSSARPQALRGHAHLARQGVKAALEKQLGAGAVASIPSVESVGAKAGKELRTDGIKAALYAMLLIMLYIACASTSATAPARSPPSSTTPSCDRAFAITTRSSRHHHRGHPDGHRYSMNDTVVVFDRVRENVARLRDRKFDRLVNQSVNETLSRTLLTGATVLFVTLAMNIIGTGVIRDFAFAMNVGSIVGTYSSIFVAAPVLIWLNDKYVAVQRRQQMRGGKAPTRAPSPPAARRRARGGLGLAAFRTSSFGPSIDDAVGDRSPAPRY